MNLLHKFSKLCRPTALFTAVVSALAVAIFMLTATSNNPKAEAAESLTAEFLSPSGGSVCKVEASKECKITSGSGSASMSGSTLTVKDLKGSTTLKLSGKGEVDFQGSASLNRIELAKDSDIKLKADKDVTLDIGDEAKSYDLAISDTKFANVGVQGMKDVKSGSLQFDGGEWSLKSAHGVGIYGLDKLTVNKGAKVTVEAMFIGAKADTITVDGGTFYPIAEDKVGAWATGKVHALNEGDFEPGLQGAATEKNWKDVIVSLWAEGGILAESGGNVLAGDDNYTGGRQRYGIVSNGPIEVKDSPTRVSTKSVEEQQADSKQQSMSFVQGVGEMGITTIYPDVEKAQDITVDGGKLEGIGRNQDGVQAKNFTALNKATIIGRSEHTVPVGVIGDLEINNSKLTTAGGSIGVHASGNVKLHDADCSISGKGDMLLVHQNLDITGSSNVRIVWPGDGDYPWGVNGIHAGGKINLDFTDDGQLTVKGLAKPEVGYGGAVTSGGPTLAYNPFRYGATGDDQWMRFEVVDGKVRKVQDRELEPGIKIGKLSVITAGKVADLNEPFHFKVAIVGDDGKPASDTAVYCPARPMIVTFLIENWPPVVVALLLLILTFLLILLLRPQRGLLILGGEKGGAIDDFLAKNIADYCKQHRFYFRKIYIIASSNSGKITATNGAKLKFIERFQELIDGQKWQVFIAKSPNDKGEKRVSAFDAKCDSMKPIEERNEKDMKLGELTLEESFQKNRIKKILIVGGSETVSTTATARDAAKLIGRNDEKSVAKREAFLNQPLETESEGSEKPTKTVKDIKETVNVLTNLITDAEVKKLESAAAKLKTIGVEVK